MTYEYQRRDMEGKVCVVTGANSGIGKVIALELSRMGAEVIMVCRDGLRGEQARMHIERETGLRPRLKLCDFASFSCVRDVANEIVRERSTVDVLVNNAGVLPTERVITEDGNELAFQVNHLSHFLLTAILRRAIEAAEQGRVVTVSSDAHLRTLFGIEFEDLTMERGWSPFKAYAHSKLANVMFGYALDRKLVGPATSNVVHPGSIDSGFGRGDWGLAGRMWNMIRPLLLTPEQGARTPLYLCTAEELSEIGGGYFYKMKPKPSSPVSHDLAQQERLWLESARLTGVEG